MVKSISKLAIAALMLSLWVSPLAACVLPDSVLTVEEQECCRQMADQCGQMQMPASHSCCTPTVRQIDPYLINQRFKSGHSQPVATALIAGNDTVLHPSLRQTGRRTVTHSPPVLRAETISILRI